MQIEISNLIKKFKNIKILDIKNLKINKGEILAIYGHSGCGKTTLLNIISGVLTDYEGNIKIGETYLNKLSEQELDLFRSKNIGYIFQNFNLLQGYNAYENIKISLQLANIQYKNNEIIEKFEEVGLKNEIYKYPSQLSLGQQQRIAILRAILKKPQIILADEPTSSLDEENTKIIIDLLIKSAISNSATLIVVTHELNILNNFNKSINFLDINNKN